MIFKNGVSLLAGVFILFGPDSSGWSKRKFPLLGAPTDRCIFFEKRTSSNNESSLRQNMQSDRERERGCCFTNNATQVLQNACSTRSTRCRCGSDLPQQHPFFSYFFFYFFLFSFSFSFPFSSPRFFLSPFLIQ